MNREKVKHTATFSEQIGFIECKLNVVKLGEDFVINVFLENEGYRKVQEFLGSKIDKKRSAYMVISGDEELLYAIGCFIKEDVMTAFYRLATYEEYCKTTKLDGDEKRIDSVVIGGSRRRILEQN